MRKKYDYDYNIFSENSPEKFAEACKAIERAFPSAVKEDLLVDVDGTTIQLFNVAGKEAIVYDDYETGAVYVLSDIDLSAAFASCFNKNGKMAV